jgi:hypothetical protein
MKCKTCGDEYHYCGSCGMDGYSEMGYCSDECIGSSYSVKNIIDFIKSLSTVKRNKLIGIFNETPDEIFWRAIKKLEKNDQYKNKKINDKIIPTKRRIISGL